MRIAIYARYSSDLQNDRSIEDQVRICRDRIKRENGWNVVQVYSDHAISGAGMMNRPGLQAMLRESSTGQFDAIVSEALDRVSRDQADTANVYKRLSFHGVRIFTLAENWIGPMEVGLKGLMNQLYLTDLKQKVLRGQRGRVQSGKIAAGLSYGYDVVRKFDSEGKPVRGERKINEEQARIVQRIFAEYDAGKSPRSIAKELNEDRVPAPRGGLWNPSTIHGRTERGYGILCNPLYSGRIVWNRVREDKEPDTLRRIPRLNDRDQWEEQEAPELRIIDEELWKRVQARLKALKRERSEIWKANRPKHLLSGLLVCGECGHGYSKRTPERYGCTHRRDKGNCGNRLRIRQDELEGAVLRTLERYFMHPEMLRACCEAYTQRTNELRKDASASVASIKAKIKRLERERKRCIEAIKGGVPGEEVKDEMIRIRDERQQLEEQLANTKDDPIRLHPRMADHYRSRISELIKVMQGEARRDEAREILRSLIDKIVLTPDADRKKLVVDLHGDLAGIIAVAEENQALPVQAKRRVGERVVALVGPEGLEPPT